MDTTVLPLMMSVYSTPLMVSFFVRSATGKLRVTVSPAATSPTWA